MLATLRTSKLAAILERRARAEDVQFVARAKRSADEREKIVELLPRLWKTG
jgi:hypothetical protein